MTIAVAVRTEASVVFAADSKVTTRGVVGIDENGTPRWVEQTYDNATKVAKDRSGRLMAMVAGAANIGQMTATDFISLQNTPVADSNAGQDEHIKGLVAEMVRHKREFWEKTPIEASQWPGPTLLLACPAAQGFTPRVWRIDLNGEAASAEEILTEPGVRLEGAYTEVFGLLYGYDLQVLSGICEQLGVDGERLSAAMQALKVLRPIDQLNLWAMPLQDAVDLAVFLASVQIQMDRFTPGIPACGGPIDVMVLRSVPEPEVLFYPGKVLHHPGERGTV